MNDMATLTFPPAIFAANVRREMQARGWTQATLAEKSGLPQPRISEILRGDVDHRIGTVDRIARAFGIPFSTLLVPPPESD